MNHTLLVVEDTKDLREYLVNVLIGERYTVLQAEDGTQALKIFEKVVPDLVILDLGLPTISGQTVCKEIKRLAPNTQVLVLTAKDSPVEIAATLNLGADDYMAKPFEVDELLARVNARLRGNAMTDRVLKAQDLSLDTEKVEVKRAEKTIQLTPLEFRLLEYLLANKGRVLTRDMILARVWSSSPEIETRVVDVYMGYLRKKVDKGFDKPLLQSIRGFGYMIND